MIYSKGNDIFFEREGVFMFSYVHLENFKSFKNITFDFHQNKHKAKNMIAIYGENGSGKSNFISAFEVIWMFFKCLPHIKPNNEFIKLLTYLNESIDLSLDTTTYGNMLDDYRCRTNIISFLNKCRMVDAVEPTAVEFGFIIDGVEGYYSIKFTEQIIFEELYYLNKERRTKLFTLSQEESKIQADISKVTSNKAYKKELNELINKYWGKYSFLSILADELALKNISYFRNNINGSVLKVILNFMSTSSLYYPTVQRNSINNTNLKFFAPYTDMLDLVSGVISADKAELLERYEQIITSYLTQLYSDVVSAYYDKKNISDKVFYQLYLRKNISGKICNINFEMESAGTKKLVDELQSFIKILFGYVSIYDEIDTNIHDLLMKNLLISLADNIPKGGQLIFTTHNTLLLEAIDPNSVYIINIDSEGNKEVSCCSDYDCKRIQKTNNLRNMYLKGMFGGIPYSTDIDFSFVKDSDNDSDDDTAEE